MRRPSGLCLSSLAVASNDIVPLPLPISIGIIYSNGPVPLPSDIAMCIDIPPVGLGSVDSLFSRLTSVKCYRCKMCSIAFSLPKCRSLTFPSVRRFSTTSVVSCPVRFKLLFNRLFRRI